VAEIGAVFEKSGHKGVMREFLKELEAAHEYYYAAGYKAMLGEKDSAFTALEQAFAVGSDLDKFKTDAALDNLRSDRRYVNLLRRIGQPQ